MSNQKNNSTQSEIFQYQAQNTERASSEYNNVNTLLSNVQDVVSTFTDYGTFPNNIPRNPQTRYLDLSGRSEYSNVTNNTQDTSGYDSEVTNNTLYRPGYDDSEVTTTPNGNVSRNAVDRMDYQRLSDNQKQTKN